MRSQTQIKDELNKLTVNLEEAEKDLALRQREIEELKTKMRLLQWVLGQTYKEG